MIWFLGVPHFHFCLLRVFSLLLLLIYIFLCTLLSEKLYQTHVKKLINFHIHTIYIFYRIWEFNIFFCEFVMASNEVSCIFSPTASGNYSQGNYLCSTIIPSSYSILSSVSFIVQLVASNETWSKIQVQLCNTEKVFFHFFCYFSFLLFLSCLL